MIGMIKPNYPTNSFIIQVGRLMDFHCLGGKMNQKEFKANSRKVVSGRGLVESGWAWKRSGGMAGSGRYQERVW